MQAFLRACRLDVAVRKPGNVSIASPGHRMHADLFLASARAAAGPLFQPGAGVGERIEGAVSATWAVAGCNTNLGIVLLCAPIAAALQRERAATSMAALLRAVEAELAALSIDDARAAYRAIAAANPGGLGTADAHDVHAEPQVDLRTAMAAAAGRDSIARQYANGFADLFALAATVPFDGLAHLAAVDGALPDDAVTAHVQRVFLGYLAAWPDSHIVRKHGEAVAHIVMSAAQAWRGRAQPGREPEFAAWDERLKAQGINPGTSADLTVATLFLQGVLTGAGVPWHGS